MFHLKMKYKHVYFPVRGCTGSQLCANVALNIIYEGPDQSMNLSLFHYITSFPVLQAVHTQTSHFMLKPITTHV